MDKAKAGKLKDEFESIRFRYERLARLVRRFLVGQVKAQFPTSKWPVLHDHQDRAKELESLHRNLDADLYKPPPKALKDIKDLAGARLIFYFRDDLDAFWKDDEKFCRWFGELAKDSRKRALGSTSDPQGRELFGYDSFHFLCEVSKNTVFWTALKDRDKRDLRNLRCEVQLRTILQHAWAEAEHDLRYKVKNWQKVAFPPEENRNWGLLAAALEGADLMLDQRKEYYVKTPQRDELVSTGKWEYKPNAGDPVGGIQYGYQRLHAAGDSTSSREVVIKEDREIFHLDEAVKKAGGPSEYKTRMWAVLMEREPDFIASSFTHDSTVARVKDWDESISMLTVQPAQYSDQMVTNHARALKQNMPNDPKLKVRDLAYGVSGELRSFAASPMSNTIGIAGMVHTRDQQWVIGLRSRKVAFDPGRWGCSTSGALEWAEPASWNGRDLETWMKQALARECEEELGFCPSLGQIHYLAFARELGRAGKPQFFFLIVTPSRWQDVESAWQIYASDKRELSKIEHLEKKDAEGLVGKDADKVNKIIGNAGLSDELRMNLALALQHLKKRS